MQNAHFDLNTMLPNRFPTALPILDSNWVQGRNVSRVSDSECHGCGHHGDSLLDKAQAQCVVFAQIMFAKEGWFEKPVRNEPGTKRWYGARECKTAICRNLKGVRCASGCLLFISSKPKQRPLNSAGKKWLRTTVWHPAEQEIFCVSFLTIIIDFCFWLSFDLRVSNQFYSQKNRFEKNHKP